MSELDFPRIKQLGVTILEKEPGPPGINWKELHNALVKHKMDTKLYCKLFGCQTAGPNGAYPWDVEAVLERMMSGKLKGSQALWD